MNIEQIEARIAELQAEIAKIKEMLDAAGDLIDQTAIHSYGHHPAPDDLWHVMVQAAQ